MVLKISHSPSKYRFSAKCSFFGPFLILIYYQPISQLRWPREDMKSCKSKVGIQMRLTTFAFTTCHLPLATCHLPLATYHLPLTTCHLPLTTLQPPSPSPNTFYLTESKLDREQLPGFPSPSIMADTGRGR